MGYLIRCALVAALGGLLFGFDTAVISGTTRALTDVYSLSPALLGITVSSALWGTVAGSLLAGFPADRYGRLACLRGLGLLYLLSAAGSAFAWSWHALLVFRVIGGLGVGASSVIGPMYIAEISPAEKRGRLAGLFQFNIVFGILLAYLSNYFIGLVFGQASAVEWRWKFGVAAIPAAVFLLALSGLPESPRWLVKTGRIDQARKVLGRLGQADTFTSVLETTEEKSGVPLFQRRYRKPIILAVTIAMFNQLSGINAILYYLNDIFERAGFSGVSADTQAVLIGLTNLIFTVIAMAMIDQAGRKTLLLIGAVGTGICLAGVAAIFATGLHGGLLIWLLVGFIASFAFSQGAVIWVYLSEVFPTEVRAKGQSLGSSTHWIMNAMISAIFPVVAKLSGAAPFVFFAVMMAVQFVVVLAIYPETKGVTLEEMAARIQGA